MTAPEPKVTPDLAFAHGLTAEEYDRIIGRAGTRADVHRARPLRRALVRALRVQALARLPPPAAHGRLRTSSRGRARTRASSTSATGLAARVQDREPQPPVVHRAVPGRGHRRRRHPPRHLHHGRAAHRHPGLPALRRSGGPADAPAHRAAWCGGISWYGNCFGVPNLGGEVNFAPEYGGNPLVNAMAVGPRAQRRHLARPGRRRRATRCSTSAPRPGATASTARPWPRPPSTRARRSGGPTVQVGDPFTEKLLLEACLEAMRTGAVVGIQDMGAAGLACACSEMPARAGTGMEIELSRVPRRETGMTPYEIMLSESQERMLLVAAARPRGGDPARLRASGTSTRSRSARVTGDGLYASRMDGRVVAEVPVRALADEAPVYARPTARPRWQDELERVRSARLAGARGPTRARCWRCSVARASRPRSGYTASTTSRSASTRWCCPAATPGCSASRAPRRVSPSRPTATPASSTSTRAWARPWRWPRRRGISPWAARGRSALTDCLNFGSPERPEILWQFQEAVAGIGEACRALAIPVVGRQRLLLQ